MPKRSRQPNEGGPLTLSALYLLINIEHIIVGFLVSLRYPLGTAPPTDVRAMDVSG